MNTRHPECARIYETTRIESKKIPGFSAEDNFFIGKVSMSRGISS